MITYRNGNILDQDAALDLYRSCSLGARRPIEDPTRLAAMLFHANLVVTAWDAQKLVGISRSMSDFAFVTYLADLAVRESYQRQGIGKELIRRTQAAAPQARIIVLAAPGAAEYYPHIGFAHESGAWSLSAEARLTD